MLIEELPKRAIPVVQLTGQRHGRTIGGVPALTANVLISRLRAVTEMTIEDEISA